MLLSAAARRRGQIALLAMSFLMFGGFFMVIPLVSVYFVEHLGLAAFVVGLALAMRQLLQQGTTLFGGALADRFGVRALIGAGVLIRSAGFVSLAWASTPGGLFAAMALSALGGALFDAPSRAAMAALTVERERARFFAINAVVGNLGMIVGPLVGALLIRYNFSVVCLVAAACFAVIFGAVLLLPPVQVADSKQRMSFGLSLAFRDRTFVTFTALLMGYWFMWVQLTLSLPLAGERLTGSSDTVGLIYAFNAGLTVLFQYPILGLAERWLRPMPILVLGVALMALGLGAVAAAGSLPVLLVCVSIFTVGTLLATPTQQTVAAALADQRALGSYFGVNALALAFGGSLGNVAGGLLTDTARRIGAPAMPWLTFALIGLASAIGLAMLSDYLLRRRATAHLVAEQA
jgi:DHA1 family multidrug resistance protein-like MFS transporter